MSSVSCQNWRLTGSNKQSVTQSLNDENRMNRLVPKALPAFHFASFGGVRRNHPPFAIITVLLSW